MTILRTEILKFLHFPSWSTATLNQKHCSFSQDTSNITYHDTQYSNQNMVNHSRTHHRRSEPQTQPHEALDDDTPEDSYNDERLTVGLLLPLPRELQLQWKEDWLSWYQPDRHGECSVFWIYLPSCHETYVQNYPVPLIKQVIWCI